MSIKKSLLAGVAGTLVAGAAMAAEPVALTDAQLDDVSAGLSLSLALGLTTGFDAFAFDSATVTVLNQTGVVESVGIQVGSQVQSLFQTQAAAGTGWNLLASGGGGGIVIDPSVAVGGTLTITPTPPTP